MSSRSDRKKKKFILIFISCIVFGTGYFLLNVVSGIFEVPLGITFHVILGCTLMAVSSIYIGFTFKQLYFTKKRKRSKQIFLDDTTDKKSS